MMRHGAPSWGASKKKSRVIWHAEVPEAVRQKPAFDVAALHALETDSELPPPVETSAEGRQRRKKEQLAKLAKTQQARRRRFKRASLIPAPKANELEQKIAAAFEAKAPFRSDTWRRNELDQRLDEIKRAEAEREANRPKTPAGPAWTGIVNTPLALRMYEGRRPFDRTRRLKPSSSPPGAAKLLCASGGPGSRSCRQGTEWSEETTHHSSSGSSGSTSEHSKPKTAAKPTDNGRDAEARTTRLLFIMDSSGLKEDNVLRVGLRTVVHNVLAVVLRAAEIPRPLRKPRRSPHRQTKAGHVSCATRRKRNEERYWPGWR